MIEGVEQFNLQLKQLPSRSASRKVLLAEPTHFAVEYVINPPMANSVGSVNKSLAMKQWRSLYDSYVHLGMEVSILPAAAGFPDLVFVANQSFPAFDRAGKRLMIMSRMFAEQRRGEVPIVEVFYSEKGIDVDSLPGKEPFEGTGDANWYPGRKLIVGGHGFRTSRSALGELEQLLDVPVVALGLVDPRFYHLDTCLSLLDETTALYVPGAFSARSETLLRRLVGNLVPVPLDEAVHGLACNGHSPDGKHYIVHHSNKKTARIVESEGFEVVPVDTGEFLKSGGSVFCMKLALV